MPGPLRVMRLAREIVVDTALGLIRVGVGGRSPVSTISRSKSGLDTQSWTPPGRSAKLSPHHCQWLSDSTCSFASARYAVIFAP